MGMIDDMALSYTSQARAVNIYTYIIGTIIAPYFIAQKRINFPEISFSAASPIEVLLVAHKFKLVGSMYRAKNP
jgi:hypothetical protein